MEIAVEYGKRSTDYDVHVSGTHAYPDGDGGTRITTMHVHADANGDCKMWIEDFDETGGDPVEHALPVGGVGDLVMWIELMRKTRDELLLRISTPK